MRRQPPRSNAEPLPGDVRLLQATAQAVSWLAGAALLGVAALWFVRQPMFDLRSVRIDGEVTRNNVATLRAQVAHRLQGNFLTADLQQVRTAFEDVTWVRQAVVQRVWPGRLVVHLQEHEPAALWLGREGDDSEHMVNRQGEIFEAGDDADGAALPQLQGPDEQAARMLQMMRTLVPLLAPLQLGEVRRLQLSSHGAWTVVLDGGARIALGRGDDSQVLARTTRFAQTLPRVLATYQRPLLSADLRHGDGFALRLQGLGTLAPDQVPPPPRRVAAVPPATRPAAPPATKPRAARAARQAAHAQAVLA